MNKTIFWMPTRPYDITAAINRMAAATGSLRRAMASATADFNGHCVTMRFNDFRGYWVAEYFWGGRMVVWRGEFKPTMDAAVREYNRGALGASVFVHVETEEHAALCRAAGLTEYTKDIDAAHHATWFTDLHKEVSAAIRLEREVGIPATSFLVSSATLAEYNAKVDGFVAHARVTRRA